MSRAIGHRGLGQPCGHPSSSVAKVERRKPASAQRLVWPAVPIAATPARADSHPVAERSPYAERSKPANSQKATSESRTGSLSP